MARPEGTLLILDLANPFRYLEVRGQARIEPDDKGAFAHKLHGKYGADVAATTSPATHASSSRSSRPASARST